MLRVRLAVILGLSACSGGNGGRDAAPAAAVVAPNPAAPSEGATPAMPAEAEAGAVALTEDMAAPYFAAGAAGEAAARFALEDWKAARKGFASALAEATRRKAEPAARARLELMIALCDVELGNDGAAAARFVALVDDLPLLADWLHFRAADAFYAAHQADKALAHARKVSPDAISGADAELLVGDILRGRGDTRAIADHYRKYLTDRPKGIRLAEARFRLAQALDADRKNREAAAEAIQLYRKVMTSSPLTRWAAEAQVALSGRPGVPPLTAAELIERGTEYFDSMRNKESEADFQAALTAPGLDAEMACVASFNLAQSIFKQRDRTRAAPLFDAAVGVCEKSANQDLLVKASYQAGRSYSNIGKHDVAVLRYARAEKDARGEHSFADDARLRQAEEHLDLGNQDKVGELLSTIPTKYPTGDMKAEAMWRLAWRDYKDGKLKEAIGWLKKQIEVAPIDDNYFAEGQAQYWMARSLEKLKKPTEAAAQYEEVLRIYPLSYYSLLALNRLRDDHPERFKAAVETMTRPPPGWDPSQPAFNFRPRALWGSDGFKRALEFLRLGLGEQAEHELRVLGLTPPGGKSRVDDPDQQDKLWAMAFLYHGAGRYGHSHWVTRWHILDFKRQWPVGANRARWEISYPKAWWPLLERHAQPLGYPTELLISFVREESAFDPLRESFANAIGLTQMIQPTAERFARGTGIKVDRSALRDPEKNVTIGSRFLKFLVDKFQGRVALVVPSYNAGEGATTKWLKERGDWAMDEFSEEIPYDETRNYSKRVIATFFSYSYLKDGSVPQMPNEIPTALIPGGKVTGTVGPPHKRIKGN
jgi:soluble lytic murein transglycosylase